ncbi:MFS transporter [Microbacterium testaceum]|uniref:Major facilitator transporter n=1 Tax=Microbacterium testaceum TaxID=2033 RepID=A0A147FB44_MICTE|nr:MFS transporter [Microbacterium testaceum]KTS13781.1 major facilitator transporter [Microbacterium testaceum]
MIHVLRNSTYRALFSAQVLALLGTGLLTVALGLLAFDLAGDSAGVVLGTALTIKMVAYVGVAPLMAALVDRMPRKVVLVGADIARLAIALSLPLVTETWQIYVLVFVLQSASATFTPAFQALIPGVLPEPRDYTRALSLSRLAYDLEALVSPGIAAALLTAMPSSHLFTGTALGFACSASLVLIARLPAQNTDAAAPTTFWQRLRTGIRVFLRTPTLRFVLATNVVVAAGTALVLVNSVVYARGVFALDDAALTLALACFGGGSLLVAFVVPRLVERFGVLRTMSAGAGVITVALAAATAVLALLPATTAGWVALLATWATLGIGTSLVNTPSSRLLADASTDADRTLVYTAQFALSHACFLVTYPLAGWLGGAAVLAPPLALLAIAGAALIPALALGRRAARIAPPVTAPTGAPPG